MRAFDTISDEQKLMLLTFIEDKGSIEDLVESGLNYSLILSIFKEIKEIGLVKTKGFDISLTEEGEKIKSELVVKLKPMNVGEKRWQQPKFASKIEPIGKDDIFLPSDNEFDF